MTFRTLSAALAVAGACWGCSGDDTAAKGAASGGSAGTTGGSGGSSSARVSSTGGRDASGGSGATVGKGGATNGDRDAAPDHGIDAGHGSAGEGDAGDGNADATTASDVVGTVTSYSGPAANLAVIVDGVTHVTNAEGKFTATGVGKSYDATAIVETQTETQVYVYLGVSTRTPVIQISTADSFPRATVSGQLSGGAGFPNSASTRAGVGGVHPGEVLGVLPLLAAAGGPGYGPMSLRWAGSTSLEATLFGLQWNVDVNGLPTAYTGWATKTLTVSDGGDFGKSDGTTATTNLALSALSDRNLSGTASVPSGLSITTKRLLIGGIGAIQAVNDVTPATSYQYRVPMGLAPVETVFRVVADGSNGEAADTTLRVDDSTASLDLSLLPPPVQVLPIDGATQVDYGTSFTFTGPPNSVHGIECRETAGNVTFVIYTMGTSVQIPDLTAAGIPLKRGTSYTWSATADGPATRVEDVFLRTIDFFEADGRRSDAFSAERTFTVSTQ